MAKSKTSVSQSERVALAREIASKLNGDEEVTFKTRAVAMEVRDHWANVAWPTSYPKGPHPYATGAYQASIKVVQNRVSGRFAPGFIVKTDHPDAVFIEFGTGVDKPGSNSPWGPNTPTPPMYPAAKTAIFFGGSAP